MDANCVARICRVSRERMVRKHGLQRPDGDRQITTRYGHAIYYLCKKRLSSACFARMEFEIHRATENMKARLEFLRKNGLAFVMGNVGRVWVGKQHRKRIVADPML